MRLSRFPLGAACPPKIQNSRPAKPAIKIGHRFEFAIYCRVGPHILLLVTGLLLQKDTAVIAYRIINGTERDTIIKFDCAIISESASVLLLCWPDCSSLRKQKRKLLLCRHQSHQSILARGKIDFTTRYAVSSIAIKCCPVIKQHI